MPIDTSRANFNQATEFRKEIEAVVTNWCPEQFHNEQFQYQFIRAFMQMRDCVKDQRRVLNGEQPVRPLEAYPKEI